MHRCRHCVRSQPGPYVTRMTTTGVMSSLISGLEVLVDRLYNLLFVHLFWGDSEDSDEIAYLNVKTSLLRRTKTNH